MRTKITELSIDDLTDAIKLETNGLMTCRQYGNVFKILNDCLCSLRKYKHKEEAHARR